MKKKTAIRFFILFFASLLILQWLFHISFIMEPLTYFTTKCTYSLLSLMKYPVSLSYNHIIGLIDMEIIYECTGIYGFVILTSGFLASWFPWEEKLIAILWGTLAIFGINQIRLVSIFIISSRWPMAFDFLHSYFWQFFLIVFVCLLFYLWFQNMDGKYPLKEHEQTPKN